jgi:hypothetical protein
MDWINTLKERWMFQNFRQLLSSQLIPQRRKVRAVTLRIFWPECAQSLGDFSLVQGKEENVKDSKGQSAIDKAEDMLQGSETLPALEFFSSAVEKRNFDYVVKVLPKSDGSRYGTVNMIVKHTSTSQNTSEP